MCLYLLVYDMLEYFTVEHCEIIIHNKTLDDIFWFVSRSVSMYLWTIPIVYIFWPKFHRLPTKSLANS